MFIVAAARRDLVEEYREFLDHTDNDEDGAAMVPAYVLTADTTGNTIIVCR
ncbi:MAG: hypothetical protein WD492_09315 [Alkalispirochaeta sp.]